MKFRPRETQVYYQKDDYTEGDIMINIPGLDEPTAAFRTYYRCAVGPGFACPLNRTMDEADVDAGLNRTDAAPAVSGYQLHQNAPNPFNPSTTISFVVPERGADIALRIYDVSVRFVTTLVNGHQPAGTRSVTWNGRNDRGRLMPSGIYFSRMTAPAFSETIKMYLIK